MRALAGVIGGLMLAASSVAAETRTFVHPRQHYALDLPEQAYLASPADADEVVVHSWAGFIVSVQAVEPPHLETLDDLVARVEARYLGGGNAWTEKLEGRPAVLGGLPAHDAVYRGDEGVSRVVVARGRSLGFVVMFFAQPEDYDRLVGVFEGMLASFRPSPAERGARPAAPPSPPAPPPTPQRALPAAPAQADPSPGLAASDPAPVAPPEPVPDAAPSRVESEAAEPRVSRPLDDDAGAGPDVAVPPPEPMPQMPEPVPLATDPSPSAAESRMAARRFGGPEYGYVIGYPAHWRVETPSSHVVVFRDGSGRRPATATVSVQNVRAPAGAASAAEAVADDLKAQLARAAGDVRYLGEGAVAFAQGEARVRGQQFLAQFTYDHKLYRQLTIVVPRPGGTVAHVWSFRAPEVAYEAVRPIAEEMLRSWSIAGAGGGGALSPE